MSDPSGDARSSSFDWAIYADATLAGLSTLVPLPFVDSAFEWFFRRRMAPRIAARRGSTVAPYALERLNRSRSDLWDRAAGCLLLPFKLAIETVVRLSRKLLYFLTIKRAVDSLARYWQRAYLLDHLVRDGMLVDPRRSSAEVDRALWALDAVLDEDDESPLTKLARELVVAPFRIVRGLFRARRGRDDRTIDRTRERMARSWYRFDDYFRSRRARFEVVYREGLGD